MKLETDKTLYFDDVDSSPSPPDEISVDVEPPTPKPQAKARGKAKVKPAPVEQSVPAEQPDAELTEVAISCPCYA